MPRRILAAVLYLSLPAVAQTTSTPISLLVEQCLQLPQELPPVTPGADPDRLALAFERQTLALNNVNDRLNYYRGYRLSPDDSQALLQCQLFLADTLQGLLASHELTDLSLALAEGDQAQRRLGKHLALLQQQSWPRERKSQLHTAQTGIRQNLDSQDLSLVIAAEQCQLPSPVPSGPAPEMASTAEPPAADAPQMSKQVSKQANKPSLDVSIAAYLMHQSDDLCRFRVWQAYQTRATERNRQAFERILALSASQAEEAGFSDFSTYRLAGQQLHTPALVKAFLDGQTRRLTVSPWDLGRALATAPKANPAGLQESTGQGLLEQSFEAMNALGLSFEPVAERLIRVWHRGRLLGELFLAPDANSQDSNSYRLMRQGVLGQQFGQGSLSLKSNLSSLRDRRAALAAIAQAVTALGKSGHAYLLNAQGSSLDSNHVPALWLQYYLEAALGLSAPAESASEPSREALALSYSEQLNVFRAKVALSSYQADAAKSYPDLAAQFSASFAANWPSVEDYPYSFSAIAFEGPLYYQRLWQPALAKLIYTETKECLEPARVFAILTINEPGLSLEQQLGSLIGEPVEPASLIRRVNHVSANQNSQSGTCPH
ncbi:M2 family metallopeptidase [Shewanella salipaludis]|uniref:Zn-dependent oligopeptidase n=1 Tax=Shewanella salipaludis TaxID=2723052 RepID=A0A972JK13_9GAMM|nr:M2 family metallopeptidase [Shewanella salipaludis]NMH63862.1 Zn-dependent oligopeptidase [Shewanella salipaludis]